MLFLPSSLSNPALTPLPFGFFVLASLSLPRGFPGISGSLSEKVTLSPQRRNVERESQFSQAGLSLFPGGLGGTVSRPGFHVRMFGEPPQSYFHFGGQNGSLEEERPYLG